MTDVTDSTTEVSTTDDSNTDGAPPAVPEPAAPVPFWQRPNIERYFMPLIVPIAVVLGVVVFVLNISRVFLAAHGHIPVVICSIVLVVILIGATVLANASLKTTSIALMTTGFVFLVFVSGWLVLGSSAEKNNANATLTEQGPYDAVIKIVAAPTGGLTFAPSSLTTTTGVYLIDFTDGANAQHTLNFDQSSTLWAGLVVNKQGEQLKSRIFFGTPGDYTFYCAVPGHRSGGMQGVVHVTGPPVTLQQAEASAKFGATGATGASG
jgi:plastocyanin